MDRAEILRQLDAHADTLRRLGVKKPWLFGSAHAHLTPGFAGRFCFGA